MLNRSTGISKTTDLGCGTGQDSTDFLEWLSFTVNEALRAAEQHESLKRVIREMRASLEDKFSLAAIQVLHLKTPLCLLPTRHARVLPTMNVPYSRLHDLSSCSILWSAH